MESILLIIAAIKPANTNPMSDREKLRHQRREHLVPVLEIGKINFADSGKTMMKITGSFSKPPNRAPIEALSSSLAPRTRWTIYWLVTQK